VASTSLTCSNCSPRSRAGETTETVRASLEWVLQQLIETEATAVIGAAPHERTETRVTQRNGHLPKLVTTAAGDVELAIPKLREGSFFPSLLEPRRRIDRALYAMVMEAYVHGVSTCKVDDLVKALGAASAISRSECHGSAPSSTGTSTPSATGAPTTQPSRVSPPMPST
jgi:putative transposase